MEHLCAAAAAAARRRAEWGGDVDEVCNVAVRALWRAADSQGLGPARVAAHHVAGEVGRLRAQRLPGAPTPFIEALEALMEAIPHVWEDDWEPGRGRGGEHGVGLHTLSPGPGRVRLPAMPGYKWRACTVEKRVRARH